MTPLIGATFTDTFPNPDGVNQNASAAGWIMEQGLNGTALPWKDNYGPPMDVAGLVVRTDSGATLDGCLLFKNAISIINYVVRKEATATFASGNIPTLVSFDARNCPVANHSGAAQSYFIVKVGTEWYAAAKQMNISGTSWTTYSHSLPPATTKWYKAKDIYMGFSPNGSSAQALSALPKGSVDGVGLLLFNVYVSEPPTGIPDPTYGLAIDNFHVETDLAGAYPPQILSTSSYKTVNIGGKTSIGVTSNVTAGVNYQWYLGGVALYDSTGYSGTRTATLTLNYATMAQAGSYSVTLTNSAGTVTSSPMVVDVVSPITFVKEMQSGYATTGTQIYLSAEVSCGNPISYLAWEKKSGASWIQLSSNSLTMSAETIGEYRGAAVSQFTSKGSSTFTLSLINQIDFSQVQMSRTSFDGAGGTANLSVTVSPTNAYWNATTTANWIHIQNEGSGFAEGNLVVTIDPLVDGSKRQATISVAEHQFIITQKTQSGESVYQGGYVTLDFGNGFKWNKLGYLYDGYYPFVYAWAIPGWLYIYGETEENYYFFDFQKEKWCWTQSAIYPWYYSMSGEDSGQAYEFGN